MIYQVFPTIVTDTRTQAQTRIATVATGALLELVGVDLRQYIGDQIELRAGGKIKRGWIGAAGGESAVTDVLAGWDLTSGWGSYISAAINDANTFTPSASVGYLRKVSGVVAGALYKGTYVASPNTGSMVNAALGLLIPATGVVTYATYTTDTIYLKGVGNGVAQDITTMQLYRVTDVPITGAKIYSSQAAALAATAASQSWASGDADYDPNYSEGCTYRILARLRLSGNGGYVQ